VGAVRIRSEVATAFAPTLEATGRTSPQRHEDDVSRLQPEVSGHVTVEIVGDYLIPAASLDPDLAQATQLSRPAEPPMPFWSETVRQVVVE